MEKLICSTEGDTLRIEVVDRMDFKLSQAFRACYERGPEGIKNYVIDFARTTSVDSAALGMLLLLRDHVGEEKERVRLINANETVRNSMRVVKFERLFSIH